jgi:hypothetical protein
MTSRREWFGLRVKLGREAAVARSLRSRGLEECLPNYSGRRCLFPGFVFCSLNSQNRRALLETPGVLSLVGASESGCPISDAMAICRLTRSAVLACLDSSTLPGHLARRFALIAHIAAMQPAIAYLNQNLEGGSHA